MQNAKELSEVIVYRLVRELVGFLVFLASDMFYMPLGERVKLRHYSRMPGL